MYTTSDSHSCGDEYDRTRVSGGLTDAVVKALGRRYSSIATSERGGGGTASGVCCGKGTRLFLRCSGVTGREDGREEGAIVGEVSVEDGSVVGSMSRSGIGGEINGLRVILRSMKRRIALNFRIGQISVS